MNKSLAQIAADAQTSTEIEARMLRFLESDATPSPAMIVQMREWMGLSQAGLAGLLGFTDANGARTVQAFEEGRRNGQPFAPTKSITKLMRTLTACRLAGAMLARGKDEEAKRIIAMVTP